ncbi:MAG: type 2 lantipeptide synthetase LanM family protein [Deltaproteobacteria bacterium]|nr:type 2 lantipeptide synthetase LanM family protein [Deltaproteobacteria bacterium]
MTTASFPASAWLRAATLRERVESARGREPGTSSIDTERAARELASWREQPPFADDDLFARRLSSQGITASEFEAALGEDIASRAHDPGPTPAWVEEIEQAYGDPGSGEPWSIAVGEEAGALETLRFLDAVEPLVRRARDRLITRAEAIVDEHPQAPFDPPSAVAMLLVPVPWSLHSMLMRAMVLELNVARVEGTLSGPTPEARFADYVTRLANPEHALAFLREYPVLARAIVAMLAKWERASAEFLDHLATDIGALRETFGSGVGPTARLTGVDGGAGDAHRDGRSVLIAHFGDDAKVVYKPRSLAVDVHFQRLLEWVSGQAGVPMLRTLAVLDRGDHGWVEFVVATPCSSLDQVRGFYRRQGALVGLLYALEAVDFHYENLIAAGEHPVLIDLESLFHARLGHAEQDELEFQLVADATARSVLRIGILPQRAPGRQGQAGPDISGLTGEAGQLTAEPVLQWDEMATDQMHARRERVPMPGADNLPQLEGEAVNVLRFESELSEGFAAVYRALMERRDQLLAPGGPIDAFGEDEVRCVLRATHGYGAILSEGFHPDHLRDGLERDRLLDRAWVGVEVLPHLERVVAHEREDLDHGDVPLFTTRVGSVDLWSSRGVRIPRVLPCSGMQQVRERIGQLDERDLAQQRWFIHASLATLEISRASLEWSRYPEVAVDPDPDPEAVRERMVEAARAVGDRLIDLSLRSDEGITWVGLQYDDESWSMAPLLEDLYAGTAGLVHVFAYLGEITGESRYTEVARRALAGYRRRLEAVAESVRTVGAFNGWGGAIWALSHWSRLWGEPALAAEARVIAQRATGLLEADQDLDVIGGAAGLIVALAALHRVTPDDEVLGWMRRAGDSLVERANPMEHGVGWFSRIDTERPITGMSHGAAGIAWALGQLFTLTQDTKYRDVAIDGIRYERSRLLVNEGNWLETDQSDRKAAGSKDESTLSVAWCYGAPGVGMARLRSLDVLDHPFVREDLEIAVATTVDRGFGRNHSLCHGDLGNLDFLMQAAARMGDEGLAHTCVRIQAMTIASIEAHGFLCGVPLGVESPSLMNGLAGIGYGLLRAAYPERVPSVLGLDPPSP